MLMFSDYNKCIYTNYISAKHDIARFARLQCNASLALLAVVACLTSLVVVDYSNLSLSSLLALFTLTIRFVFNIIYSIIITIVNNVVKSDKNCHSVTVYIT